MTDITRNEIIDAVAAADVCCPEQVCDMVLAAADRGEDWRAELSRAKEADSSERKALGIE